MQQHHLGSRETSRCHQDDEGVDEEAYYDEDEEYDDGDEDDEGDDDEDGEGGDPLGCSGAYVVMVVAVQICQELWWFFLQPQPLFWGKEYGNHHHLLHHHYFRVENPVVAHGLRTTAPQTPDLYLWGGTLGWLE